MEIGRSDVTFILYLNDGGKRPLAVYDNRIALDIIKAGATVEGYSFEEATEANIPTVILKKGVE